MKKEMFFISFILLLTRSTSSILESGESSLTQQINTDRQAKLIRLKIPGPICASNIGGMMNEGYCDGIASCLSYGGKITGLCANGIGFCCVVTSTCGRRAPNRVTYFTNQGQNGFNDINDIFNLQNYLSKPQDILGSLLNKNKACALTVPKFQTDVTQLRLDFISFDLVQPNAAGGCPTENFTISGQLATSLVPTLCGTNTGNHLYVRYNVAGGPITLTANIPDGSASSFSIKITQISGGVANEAPVGCLQYFPELTGTVESFNFNGNQLVNFGYTFCVQRTATVVVWNSNDFVVGAAGDATCTRSDYLDFGLNAVDVTTQLPHQRVCVSPFPAGGVQARGNTVSFVSTQFTVPRQKFRLTYMAS